MLSFWCAARTYLSDDNGYLVLLADVLLQQHVYFCVSMLHVLVEAFIPAMFTLTVLCTCNTHEHEHFWAISSVRSTSFVPLYLRVCKDSGKSS